MNPSKEISSQDRDDFWRKEEEEERHRVELERERRDKELVKQEEVGLLVAIYTLLPAINSIVYH